MFLEELAEVRKELKGIQREVRQLKRHIAWNRVIDSAIHLCRVLAKAEADEAKFNPNWAAQPRVPKRNPGAGEWTSSGGGTVQLTAGGAGQGRRGSGARIGTGASGQEYRLSTGNVEIPPNMQVPVRTAFERAEAAVARARRDSPNWKPQPELSRPRSTPQELIDFANRVEAQAQREIARQASRIGHNQGPKLDEPFPSKPATGLQREPFNSNDYRPQLGLPERQGRTAWRKGEGTVAYSEIDGEPVFGVNSTAPSYTAADRTAATNMRDSLISKYPDLMNTENLGRKPNDSVFHGEATVLIRAARNRGGSLRGYTIDIHVDRVLCGGCRSILPKLGLELGNPRVRFFDPYGNMRSMENGRWEKIP